METKESLRKKLRDLRAKLSEKQSIEAGTRIIQYLKDFKNFDNWLLYAPIQNEISTRPVFDWLRAKNKSCFFPKMKGDSFQFHRADSWDQLKPNGLIPEPPKDSEIFKGESAIVLVPAVGFSISGHRLGFGKGHFDRFLRAHPKFLRVGIAYPLQIQLKDWQIEEHDEPMDFVISASGLWSMRR